MKNFVDNRDTRNLVIMKVLLNIPTASNETMLATLLRPVLTTISFLKTMVFKFPGAPCGAIAEDIMKFNV